MTAMRKDWSNFTRSLDHGLHGHYPAIPGMPCDNHPDHQRRPQRRYFYKEAPVQDQLMNIHAVKERVSMGKTKIYSLIKEKNFPRPYHHPSLGKFAHWLAFAIQALIGAVASGAEWKDNDKQRAA